MWGMSFNKKIMYIKITDTRGTPFLGIYRISGPCIVLQPIHYSTDIYRHVEKGCFCVFSYSYTDLPTGDVVTTIIIFNLSLILR